MQDAAELLDRVALILRWGQESPLHPVLHRVGLQTGNVGDLAEYHASCQEHGREHFFHAIGVIPLDLEYSSGNCPFHRLAPPCFVVI